MHALKPYSGLRVATWQCDFVTCSAFYSHDQVCLAPWSPLEILIRFRFPHASQPHGCARSNPGSGVRNGHRFRSWFLSWVFIECAVLFANAGLKYNTQKPVHCSSATLGPRLFCVVPRSEWDWFFCCAAIWGELHRQLRFAPRRLRCAACSCRSAVLALAHSHMHVLTIRALNCIGRIGIALQMVGLSWAANSQLVMIDDSSCTSSIIHHLHVLRIEQLSASTSRGASSTWENFSQMGEFSQMPMGEQNLGPNRRFSPKWENTFPQSLVPA